MGQIDPEQQRWDAYRVRVARRMCEDEMLAQSNWRDRHLAKISRDRLVRYHAALEQATRRLADPALTADEAERCRDAVRQAGRILRPPEYDRSGH